jgi:hypothetical protein
MGKPSGLEQTLQKYASFTPPKESSGVHVQSMKRQRYHRASGHQKVAHSELPNIFGEQAPLTDVERNTRLLDVLNHSRDHHNRKRNPEQDEEASEITIIALRIKM